MLRKGDRLTATALNSLVQSTKAGRGITVKENVVSARDQLRPGSGDTITVIQDTASNVDLKRFGVCVVTGIAYSSATSMLQPVFTVRERQSGDEGLPVCVLQDAIAPNESSTYDFAHSAEAVVSGTTPALVNRTDGTEDNRLDAAEGSVAGTLGTNGDLLVLGEEGDPSPAQDEHLAFCVFMPQGGEGSSPTRHMRVIGGNTVTGAPGIKKVSTLLTQTAAVRDPGVQAVATATVSAGSLTGFIISNGGSVYNATGTSVIIGPPNTPGAQATASPVVSGGVITGISVVNAGSGYTTPPSVTITSPNGVPAGLPWEDGLGYGDLVDPNGATVRALIVHDPRAPFPDVLVRDMGALMVSRVGSISDVGLTWTATVYHLDFP